MRIKERVPLAAADPELDILNRTACAHPHPNTRDRSRDTESYDDPRPRAIGIGREGGDHRPLFPDFEGIRSYGCIERLRNFIVDCIEMICDAIETKWLSSFERAIRIQV